MDQEHKRQLIIKRKMGDIGKQDRHQEIKGPAEPQTTDRHPEGVDVEDFYKIKSGGRTEREIRLKDDRYLNLLEKVKGGFIPTALEVSQYSAKQQREILRLIPWNVRYSGGSSLIKGKGKHTYTDLDGKPLKQKVRKKTVWKF